MVARWFRIAFAQNAFRRYLVGEDLTLGALRAGTAVAAVLGFYRASRAQHTTVEEDGDGVLWQWGPDSDATRFTVGLTRQLVRDGKDEALVQLTLCLAYRWTPARRALGRGHLWCFDPRDGSDDFERVIRRSPAFRAVATAAPVDVTLRTDTL